MPERGGDGAWGVLEAALAAAGMCAFALLVHTRPPFAAAGLAATLLAVYRCFARAADPLAVLGMRAWPRWALAVGAALGIGLGVACRNHLGLSLFPPSVTVFAVTAALVGATEELVYRGYVQGRLARLGGVGAVALAAAAHTAYKVCLFALPAAPAETDFLVLGLYTFLGGLVFGALRQVSRSVVPPLLAHALFDIIVYGGRVAPPWWVWA